MRSGLKTPIAEIPTPALAVPYAAPKHVKTMALVQPIAPKKGYQVLSVPFNDLFVHHLSVRSLDDGVAREGRITMRS